LNKSKHYYLAYAKEEVLGRKRLKIYRMPWVDGSKEKCGNTDLSFLRSENKRRNNTILTSQKFQEVKHSFIQSSI
jgi:hypothetical protein